MKRIVAVTENDAVATKSFVSPTISIDSIKDMQDLIVSTIQSGGSLYDYDYKELCIAVIEVLSIHYLKQMVGHHHQEKKTKMKLYQIQSGE